MSEAISGMVREICGQVEANTSPEVATRVLAGANNISAKSTREEVSLWVKDAIARLDERISNATRRQIMEACGRNCSRRNHAGVERGKARRAKFRSEADFLAAEIKKPQTGTRLELDGKTLYQIYTPTEYTRPMRCYCALMGGLPPQVKVSPTYCRCSQAFAQAYWEEVLGRKVTVDVMETALTGSKECRFKVNL